MTPRSKSLPLLSCRPRAAMASLRDKALMRRRRYAQRRVVCAAVRPCWGALPESQFHPDVVDGGYPGVGVAGNVHGFPACLPAFGDVVAHVLGCAMSLEGEIMVVGGAVGQVVGDADSVCS